MGPDKMLSLMEVMGALGGISFAIVTFAMTQELRGVLQDYLITSGAISTTLLLVGTCLLALTPLISSELAFNVSIQFLILGDWMLLMASVRILREILL
jgi:hypothetical protein